VTLRTAKTGVPVRCPALPVVVESLTSSEPESEHYFFRTGKSERGALGRLFKMGTPRERVSALLVHSNIKLTQEYYHPWVKERQDQLEEDVRRTWHRDPILLLIGPGKAVSIRKRPYTVRTI
jgi:hypothetical protein